MIVKNEQIRKELIKRWDELGIRPTDIINDAFDRGVKIAPDRLSRYKNQSKDKKTGKGYPGLTEEVILWLCFRWGLPVQLKMGKPIVEENGQIKYKIMPYDEAVAVKMLNLVFPNVGGIAKKKKK